MIAAIGFHVAESTFFASLVAVFVFAFRKCGASLRYALWLTAVAKFAVPVGLFSIVGNHVGSMLPSEYSFVAGAASFPIHPYSVLNAPAALAANQHSAILVTIGALWVSGALLTLGIWIHRYLAFHQTWNLPVDSEPPMLERLRQRLRVGKAVKLQLTGSKSELALWGIWRPTIRIPEGLSSQLTQAQFEAVLMHELVHVGRWDNLASAFVHIVVCLFWFHPFLWWMERRLVVERERACDEAVIQSGVQPEAYLAAILKVCRFQLGHVFAGASGISGSDLKYRMELIMSNDLQNSNPRLRRVVLTGLASVMTLVPFSIGIFQQPTLQAQQATASTTGSACRFAGVEYREGAVLQMGTSRSSKKACVQGSWEKTDRPATAVAKNDAERPVVCKPEQSTSPTTCACSGAKFSLGAIVNTPEGVMRCDKFVLGQFMTWRAATSADLGTSK
jgi:beta-lactamase regulating signal transducer with metallopeptidase domain